MDIVAPFVKTGVISESVNQLLAVPIGFLFGYALYRAGFTDSCKVGRTFYLKEIDVPLTMLSAIVTGMLGLWLLALVGFIDASKMYFLPSFVAPMAVGGLLFGVGMALGGYCPGTAAASLATGRIDAMVFVAGFLGGSIVFGDLYPVLGDFYRSDYRGVYRLDQLFGIELGVMILIVVIGAISIFIALRLGQRYFWPETREGTEGLLGARPYALLIPVALSLGLAFFGTSAFLPGEGEPGYYIVPKERTAIPSGASTVPSGPPLPAPGTAAPRPPRHEGC